jgi:hypothetical protein
VTAAVAGAAAVAVSDVTSKAAAVKTTIVSATAITIATTAGQLQPPQQQKLQLQLQQPL